MRTPLALPLAVLLLGSCTKKGAESSTPPDAPPPAGERPSLTGAECQAKGGAVVGDIGDGAIHRPDYLCEGGQKPLGTIRAAEGEPTAVEGAVCCPAAPAAEPAA